jgi:rhamnulokinase
LFSAGAPASGTLDGRADRPVQAGPVEATALGNVLVQALGLGELSGLTQLRQVVARSVLPRRFEPDPTQPSEEIYQRFLTATGLDVNRPISAPT